MPEVSVVIPVYNGINYLSEAINSVFKQTYTNYEVLIIDDGSTDETWELIQSFGNRVRGFRKPNGGVASALNLGIREMQGRWFAWLSHDDIWLPQKLEWQVDYLNQNKGFAACYTDYYLIDEHSRIIGQVETPWYPRKQAIQQLFNSMYINGSTMFIYHDCFEQVGKFSEQWRYTQDAEMWLRLLRHYEVGRVPEKLIGQRSHCSQGSVQFSLAHREETLRLYQHMFEVLGIAEIFPEHAAVSKAPAVLSNGYIWLGDTMGSRYGAWDFAHEQYIKALLVDPSIGNPARIKLFSSWLRGWLIPIYKVLHRILVSLRHVLDRR